MVRPINKEYTLLAADQDYFANDVTGATWTITTNVLVTKGGYQIALKNNSATDHSGKTVIFTGLNQDGKAQTETIAMPAGSETVLTTLYFSSLTSAVPSATIESDTMDIGYTTAFASQTIPLDYGSVGALLSVDYTGTMTYSVNTTSDNIQVKNPPFNWQVVGEPFNEATASENTYLLQASKALQVAVASYTGTPTFEFSILQQQNMG
jgi:hypothetical protein